MGVRALFEAPTVAGLAEWIGSHAEAAGVGAVDPRASGGGAVVVRAVPVVVHRPTPGPSAVYNMAIALQLRGELDVEALGAALFDVVGRHESLRTIFIAPEGIPQQIVVPAELAGVGGRSWTPLAGPSSGLHAAADEAARHHFDLSTEIPVRATLFRVAADDHVLVGWCITSPVTAVR